MRRVVALFGVLVVTWGVGWCAGADGLARPGIVPDPLSVSGVSAPVVSLNGKWFFTQNPPDTFWRNDVELSGWSAVTVPGEPWMEGFRIERDKEYPCKTCVAIPADFAGQRILLRFDGVYSLARVWVNGRLLGRHYGGFTSWNVDITDAVRPGENAWVTVAFTDLTHDPSFASGYASRYLGVNDVPHYIGGILRGVSLIAVPPVHIARLYAVTELDDEYRDAELTVGLAVANASGEAVPNVACRVVLRASSGETVLTKELEPMALAAGETNAPAIVLAVRNPLKWDAEHPNLYTLGVDIAVGGRTVERVERRIGFREVEVVGAELCVNGRRVKLRGGCRHSVHPLAGRAEVPGLSARDVRLYKDANINYIRTSHYPADVRFLELCDEYGIYVEEEMPICWLDHHAAKGKLNDIRDDPAVLPYFMTAVSETVARDRSHPSIIIWSLGNENVKWGKNFERERDYLRREDPTRPIKTGHNHYNGGWNSAQYTDIDSYHYPSWNSTFDDAGHGKPFLADEYAHVMCYYGKDSFADRDPAVRNFWGESLKRFWDAMYPAKGTLGGAIWGTIDEVFETPDRCLGYGRWGIFDGWRRPKPEFWNTKKAYSPVRIANRALGNPGEGKPLRISVANWFDHTDFGEVNIAWRVGEDSGRIAMPLAPGGTQGVLELPARRWRDSDVVELTFSRGETVFDRFRLPLTERPAAMPESRSRRPPVLREDGDLVLVSGEGFSVSVSKRSGQLVEGAVGGEVVAIGGPELNLTPLALSPFEVGDVRSTMTAGTGDVAARARIAVKGRYGDIGFSYVMLIDGDGLIELNYMVDKAPPGQRAYDEVGVSFVVPSRVDRVAWDRRGLWSVYPDGHLGRNTGVAVKLRQGPPLEYRREPTWPWELDMKDFHQYGPEHAGYGMTQDFRASKEHIYWAEAFAEGAAGRLRIESDGERHAVRMGFAPSRHAWTVDDRDAAVSRSGAWHPYGDGGDMEGTELYSDKAGSYVECRFSGTSIAWIGARNYNLGKADVYLDGTLCAADVDAYASSKQHRERLFSRTGLTPGEHTLRVVVKGTRNPLATDAYVLIDGFSDVPSDERPLRVNVNRQWTYLPGWGNYGRAAKLTPGFEDTVWLRLH